MSALQLNQQQQVAAEYLAGRLLISAGAGSGKTRVLTERVANAVLPAPHSDWTPVDISRVLAITFTEKAAGELADRVRGGLRSRDGSARAAAVDSAWISTIHAMCSRILRTSSLEAGLDPAFVVLDGVESNAVAVQAFEMAAHDELEAGRASSLFALMPYEDIEKVVINLAAELRVRRMATTELSTPSVRDARSLLREATDFFEATARDLQACDAANRAVEAHLGSCSSTACRLRSLYDVPLSDEELAAELCLALDAHVVPATYAGIRDVRDAIRDAKQRLAREAAGMRTRRPLIELLGLVEAFATRFDQLKQERCGLDFDDLQIAALRLLDHPVAGREWAGAFGIAMVDEFQDTDRLQLALVERLAGSRLCTVGDEQQSIYRFRGADLRVYREHRQQMCEQGAREIVLHQNYRSHEAILRFVNHVFSASSMFGEALVRLSHARSEPESAFVDEQTPRVELLMARTNGSCVETARAVLAREIATRLAKLRDEQNVPCGDMVMLLPAYTHAEIYASALRKRGLDAVIVGGSRFFGRPEVEALRATLRVLSNARDEQALVLLLSSDIVGLSDDGLLAVRRSVEAGEAPSLWHGLKAARLSAVDAEKAAIVVRAVDAARKRVGGDTLGDVILMFVEETGYDVRLLGQGIGGHEAYANVLKLARMLTSAEAGGAIGPAAVHDYLCQRETLGDQEPPATLGGDGFSAVRIMSIHAAKGLEFPVVAVAELGTARPSDRSFAAWDLSGTGEVAMTLPRSWGLAERAPQEFSRIKENERAAQAEEDKRLLYVACTRARELLLLSGAAALGADKNGGSRLGMLLDALDALPGAGDLGPWPSAEQVCLLTLVDGERPQSEKSAEEHAPPPSEVEQSEWLHWAACEQPGTLALPAPLEVPSRLSYTRIKAYRDCGLRYWVEYVLGLSAPRVAGDDPRTFGTALHAALEVFAENMPVSEERLRAISQSFGLAEGEQDRLRSAIEAYRTSSIAARAAAFPRVRREAPFALWVGQPGEGFVLDGSIDVYASDGTNALVVDYKSGRGPESEDAGRAGYELQAQCYALAAVRDGHRRVEVVFVHPESLRDGMAIEIGFELTAEDAQGIEEHLLETHTDLVAGRFPSRDVPRPECGDCAALPSLCPHKQRL